jgi:hypothetical protein
VSAYVSFLSLLGNDSVNMFLRQRIQATIEKLLDVPFSMRFMSYQGDSVGVSIYPLSFLGNNSLKTFPRQRRIVGGVVFYAVRVLSKGK